MRNLFSVLKVAPKKIDPRKIIMDRPMGFIAFFQRIFKIRLRILQFVGRAINESADIVRIRQGVSVERDLAINLSARIRIFP